MAKQASLYLALSLTCFISFVKFVNTDVDSDDPSTWPGHMEPLGSRNVKHSVPVVDGFLEPQKFFGEYVAQNKPLLIKNGAKISPAFELWSDDYFLSLPGAENTTVFVEQKKKENRTFPGYETSFKDYVLKYNDSDIYMVNGVPDILQKDILLPPSLLCEDLTPYFEDTVMWFSSGGTKSVFHHDDVENINCLYRGSKTLLFVDYHKYKMKLRLDNAWGGFSGVDIDHVNFIKYPIFRDVEFHEAKMESGDCLYIPYRWFHQVTSSGRNIAVNIWWKHSRSFVPKKCGGMEGATLDKFRFSSLEKQKKEAEGGEAEEEGGERLLDMFTKILRTEKELTFDQFIHHLREAVPTDVKPELEGDVLEFAGHIFQSADANKDGVLSLSDLNDMSEKDLSELENDVDELEGILGEYHDPVYGNDVHVEL